jgi:hypothetical protein
LPEAVLDSGFIATTTTLLSVIAFRELTADLVHERRESVVEAVTAQWMTGTVRRLTLNTVEPAFSRSVHNRGRLGIWQVRNQSLRSRYLLKISSVWHKDDIPVVDVCQLFGIPLYVIAWNIILSADIVGIDRCLIPVDM